MAPADRAAAAQRRADREKATGQPQRRRQRARSGTQSGLAWAWPQDHWTFEWRRAIEWRGERVNPKLKGAHSECNGILWGLRRYEVSRRSWIRKNSVAGRVGGLNSYESSYKITAP